jgi:hypothetical protein
MDLAGFGELAWLGTATEKEPGQYACTDSMTSSSDRFYLVGVP